MRALIVADDLTGALDSAVMLAARGLRTLVARRPADVAAALARRPEVLAVSTATREGAAAAARQAVAAAADAVGTMPEIVFKKIDSRLKGHVAAEVAALAARAGLARAMAAPGVPAQGRRVAGGMLVGTGVAAPIDVAAALAGSGLAVAAPDTDGDADFDAALAAALAGPPTLLAGAAGLAAALGRRLAPGAVPPPAAPGLAGPILLAVGSHDPITLAQVGRAAAHPGIVVAEAPGGVVPELPAGAPAALLRLTAGEGVFDPAAAGARFAAGVAGRVREGRFRALLGCGGETADAILGALGVGVVEVLGEVLPGVPVSAMVVAGREMRLVTKSGGFGGEDALLRVVAAAGSLEGA